MFKLGGLLINFVRGLLSFLIVMVVSFIGAMLGSAIACTFCICAFIVLRFVHMPFEVMAFLITIPAIAMIFIPTMTPVALYCNVSWLGVPLISRLISGLHTMRLSTSFAVLGAALGILLVMLGALYGSLPEIVKYINQVMAG